MYELTYSGSDLGSAWVLKVCWFLLVWGFLRVVLLRRGGLKSGCFWALWLNIRLEEPGADTLLDFLCFRL